MNTTPAAPNTHRTIEDINLTLTTVALRHLNTYVCQCEDAIDKELDETRRATLATEAAKARAARRDCNTRWHNAIEASAERLAADTGITYEDAKRRVSTAVLEAL